MYERTTTFVSFVDTISTSASILGRGIRWPNAYIFVMRISPWIDLTTMNCIVAMLIQGPVSLVGT
jgi:hypothetical protein